MAPRKRSWRPFNSFYVRPLLEILEDRVVPSARNFAR